jgi:CHASE2 domain-containing sensor protein
LTQRQEQCLLVSTFLGLVIMALVRPKNRAADLVAGALTGFLAGMSAYLVSVGWLGVAIPILLTGGHDLALLSSAAGSRRRRDGRRRRP